MYQMNQQACSNFWVIRQQWADFLTLLENENEKLTKTINSVSTAFQTATEALADAKTGWSDLLSTSKTLAGISYA